MQRDSDNSDVSASQAKAESSSTTRKGILPWAARQWEGTRAIIKIVGAIVALITTVAGTVTAAIQSEAINPVTLRLDMLFPTKQPELLEDMVAIHFAFYKDKDTSAPESLERYTDPDGMTYKVFNKANYLEFITMRKTRGKYRVDLSSSGIAPEIIALSPDMMTNLHSGSTTLGHGLGFEFDMSGDKNQATPSLKLMYVYRNGYSPGNTSFGKNVVYRTERFSAILDFSQIGDYESTIAGQPAACLRKAGTERLEVIQNVRWEKGVAFVDIWGLEKGDRVRVFWNWRNTPDEKRVDCASAMR